MGIFDLFGGKKAPVAPAPKRLVLVVDDEQYIREFYQELLTQEGFDVTMATNGMEALTSVTQRKPELILLDINMPELSGNDVLKKLWDNPQTKTIPVIMLTNEGNINNMEQAKFYNAYKFLIKANTAPEEVISVVKEALKIYT